VTPEGKIKSEIIKLLEKAGYYVIRNLQGSIMHRKNHPGISDLTVIKAGRVTWAEIKTPTGRHRPGQKDFRASIEHHQGEYVTWASVDDCIRWLYQNIGTKPTQEVAGSGMAGGATARPLAGS